MLDDPIFLRGFGPHVTEPDKPAIDLGWTLHVPVSHVPVIDWPLTPDKPAGAALIVDQ
jgi:hypothetical protein